MTGTEKQIAWVNDIVSKINAIKSDMIAMKDFEELDPTGRELWTALFSRIEKEIENAYAGDVIDTYASIVNPLWDCDAWDHMTFIVGEAGNHSNKLAKSICKSAEYVAAFAS